METKEVKEIKVSGKVGKTKSVEAITDSIKEVKKTSEIKGTTKSGIRFKIIKGIIFLM